MEIYKLFWILYFTCTIFILYKRMHYIMYCIKVLATVPNMNHGDTETILNTVLYILYYICTVQKNALYYVLHLGTCYCTEHEPRRYTYYIEYCTWICTTYILYKIILNTVLYMYYIYTVQKNALYYVLH